MKPQSLSILVPGGCPNDCPCCVSKLHDSPYQNELEKNLQFEDLYRRDYTDALKFARDNQTNDLIFTGENGECLSNIHFIEKVVEMNKTLPSPFIKCELQTSGCYLLKKAENGGEVHLRWLRDYVRVKIISLSVFDIFDSVNNSKYTKPKNQIAYVPLEETCKAIKKYNFTLRLSINMTNLYEKSGIPPHIIFERAKQLGADQITFRVLYYVNNPQNEKEKEINEWILENRCSDEYMKQINDYIIEVGNPLDSLSFGATRFSVNGLSTVIDNNCMGVTTIETLKDDIKYLILRTNCKLYTKWDDPGSLLF